MTIEIRGIDELLTKLDRLKKMQAVVATMRAAALWLKGKVATYPPQSHLKREMVYGSPFQSDKQRKYFFWALENGEIDVPYHRGVSAGSERLGQSWTIGERDGGLTQIIGNDTSYGPLVQGSYTRGEQSEYMHASGWTPTDELVDNYEDELVRNVTDALQKEIDSD